MKQYNKNKKDEFEVFDSKGRLSKEYLLKRGFCCNNGCYNCPYKK
ncbi:MAG: DUF5522 domain-containing protein [bacterium]